MQACKTCFNLNSFLAKSHCVYKHMYLNFQWRVKGPEFFEEWTFLRMFFQQGQGAFGLILKYLHFLVAHKRASPL